MKQSYSDYFPTKAHHEVFALSNSPAIYIYLFNKEHHVIHFIRLELHLTLWIIINISENKLVLLLKNRKTPVTSLTPEDV